MYLWISSEDDRQLYPSQEAGDFRVQLPETVLVIPGTTVAVVDILTPSLTSDNTTEGTLYIFSSICQSSYLHGSKKPVLCCIEEDETDSRLRYPTELFVPLAQSSLGEVHIYIRDSEGRQPSFEEGPLECTLEILQ
jgi:hypothetical protein